MNMPMKIKQHPNTCIDLLPYSAGKEKIYCQNKKQRRTLVQIRINVEISGIVNFNVFNNKYCEQIGYNFGIELIC